MFFPIVTYSKKLPKADEIHQTIFFRLSCIHSAYFESVIRLFILFTLLKHRYESFRHFFFTFVVVYDVNVWIVPIYTPMTSVWLTSMIVWLCRINRGINQSEMAKYFSSKMMFIIILRLIPDRAKQQSAEVAICFILTSFSAPLIGLNVASLWKWPKPATKNLNYQLQQQSSSLALNESPAIIRLFPLHILS